MSVKAFLAVLRRPGLWWTALVQLKRLAEPGWWHRVPMLPLPPKAYLDFRIVTQYGSSATTVTPGDTVNYLMWCRQWNRSRVTEMQRP